MKIVYFSPLHRNGYGEHLFTDEHVGLGAGRWVGVGAGLGSGRWVGVGQGGGRFGYSSLFSLPGGRGQGNGEHFRHGTDQIADTYTNPHYLLTR